MAAHPPRLLFVVHSAKLAGAQRVALGQAQTLARDYELVIAIDHGPLRPHFAQLGRVVRGPTRLPIWGASRRRWALEILRAVPDAVRLALLARRRHVTAIVANSTTLVSPVLAGRLARIPVIVHAQEAPTSRAAQRLFRFHRSVADTVVAISPWIAQELTGDAAGPGPRAHVLLNPVGIPLPPKVVRAPRWSGAPLRVVVIGTLDAHKRQDLAIRAVAGLHDHGVSAVLELVGPEMDLAYGRELRDLAARHGIADRVRFTGPTTDVGACLHAADVLLLPAGEVTPLVLMEAMAHGTPIVAVRMGSVATVVVDGESGLLVEQGDIPAMTAALRRIAQDPGLTTTLSDAGRLRAETRFDERQSHERLRAELDAVAGR